MPADATRKRVSIDESPARHPADPRYTIIAPVYRVEKYLDAFFGSIVGQTISFEDRIQLIVVDDGSDDGSTDICRKWQDRYPANISYLRRDNGGAFSAVREGMALARGEWVAMFGADDFIDPTYFAAIESALERHADDAPSMLVCRQVLFLERENRHSDSHPLRSWFERGLRLARLDEGPRPEFQLSAASALLRRDEVSRVHDVEDIRPNFEDANFIARYLLNQRSPTMLLVPDAVYHYRKRADASSLLDAAPSDPRRYSELLEKGYLNLLVDAQRRKGDVPLWVQRLVLYDLGWQIRAFIDVPDPVLPIPHGMRDRYHALLERIFAYIDISTIVAFELPPVSTIIKMGIIERYRHGSVAPARVEMTGLDRQRLLVGMTVLHAGPLAAPVRFLDAGAELIPRHVKTHRHQFVGQPFAHETTYWLPWTKDLTLSAIGPAGPMGVRDIESARFGASLNFPRPEIFSHKKSSLNSGVDRTPPGIVDFAGQPQVRRMFQDAWLLCDRSWRADDNAEHLYRYLRSIGMPVNAWFVLDRKSPDWNRLASEGFRLLPFGTRHHGAAALLSKNIISSHIGPAIPTPHPAAHVSGMVRHAFTFLGHGVAANENSGYLNLRSMDRVICANEREVAFLREQGSHHRIGDRELALTGLPRHDALLGLRATRPDRILVMPTWRKSLLRGTNNQEVDAEFASTDYFRRWRDLARSPELHAIAESARLRITFLLHPMMRSAAKHFVMQGVETIVEPSGSIQALMSRAMLLVTDYSSICFDMAYLERPTVHYQFDEAAFFGGEHTVRRGWFDYRRDGFGPVCVREEEVVSEVRRILRAGGVHERLYAQRMRDFFPVRDGRCCERVYHAIREAR